MKHSGENKNKLDFFDSTSFLMLAVLVALAAIVFLPLSALPGDDSGASGIVSNNEQTIEYWRQNISDESPESPETIDCPMKSQKQDLRADNSLTCRYEIFKERGSELTASEKTRNWQTASVRKIEKQ